MKTVFRLRHCKGGGTPANAGDHDRTLHEAGVKDAQVVGRYLENTGAAPRLALCSTALRAEAAAVSSP